MCGKKRSAASKAPTTAAEIYEDIKVDAPLSPLADLNTGSSTYAPKRKQALGNVSAPTMGNRARSLLMNYGLN